MHSYGTFAVYSYNVYVLNNAVPICDNINTLSPIFLASSLFSFDVNLYNNYAYLFLDLNHLNHNYIEYSLASYYITNGFYIFTSFESNLPSTTSNYFGNDNISGFGSLFFIRANTPYLLSINAPGPKLNLIVTI